MIVAIRVLMSCFVLGLGFTFSVAWGDLVVDRTRIIIQSPAREVSLQILNAGEYPVVVQSWLDLGDTTIDPNLLNLSLTSLPPLVRLSPQEVRAIRIVGIPPAEKKNEENESLYWLNLQEIPLSDRREAMGAMIAVSTRLRLKVFNRTAALVEGSEEAIFRLSCVAEQRRGGVNVSCRNPSYFHITIDSLVLQSRGGEKKIDGTMLYPGSQTNFYFGDVLSGVDSVLIKVIDDHGLLRFRRFKVEKIN
ncbi:MULTISPECIES: fimbrial biogenesis chaperone [Pseudomonas]|uniref:fimbrial biogenesis chaperone n=1 Tax=Pseudomonas TaxID=286 RepID=UPI00235E597F|nr:MULTISPECIES: molecular chaperone [Pseudomonas]WJV24465.1 molecular chaperone [Pseudomonas chlororaphis]